MLICTEPWSLAWIRRLVALHLRGMYRSTVVPDAFCLQAQGKGAGGGAADRAMTSLYLSATTANPTTAPNISQGIIRKAHSSPAIPSSHIVPRPHRPLVPATMTSRHTGGASCVPR